MTNTDALRRVFTIEAVERRHLLYVATEQSGVLLATRGLRDLAQYTLASRRTLWVNESVSGREMDAFHDLLVCIASRRFVGNSVSTCALPLLRDVHLLP